MDTRLKKSKAGCVWLCFFFGVNLFVSAFALGLTAGRGFFEDWQDIRAAVFGDVKDSKVFKTDISNRLDFLLRYPVATEIGFYNKYGLKYQIDSYWSEGRNLIYWTTNTETHDTLTNLQQEPSFDDAGQYILPEGYDFYIYFDGMNLQGVKNSRPFNIYHDDSGYRELLPKEFVDSTNVDDHFGKVRTLIAVKKDITAVWGSSSQLHEIKKQYNIGRWFIATLLAMSILGVALLILFLLRREAKLEYDKRLASVFSNVMLDIKIVVSLVILELIIKGASGINNGADLAAILIVGAIGFWWVYFLLIDILNNRIQFLKNHFLLWAFKKYRTFEAGKPFKKKLLNRVYALIVSEAFLVLLVVLFLTLTDSRTVSFFVSVIGASVGAYLLFLYMRLFKGTLDDFDKIVAHSETLKKDMLAHPLSLSTDSDLLFLKDTLNAIQSGVKEAVDEKIRSDRLKVELITNVSHDLKTPLTSIISYIDLLREEENVPDYVKDYVGILSRKSQRLKLLIQDIFDLSKAATGEMELCMEPLDLSRLIEQTLADMDSELAATTLVFKACYPDKPVMVAGDGKKLYRVFLNLLSNVLKYSLEGSRVYVDVWENGANAFACIKNISNYEMNFKEQDILERFARGDKARTTEGSGLGLAIAKSYVEAMDGKLEIKVDGDLFKVTVVFRCDQPINDTTENAAFEGQLDSVMSLDPGA